MNQKYYCWYSKIDFERRFLTEYISILNHDQRDLPRPSYKMIKLKPKQNPVEKYFNKLSFYHYYHFLFVFLSKVPIFWHILNLIFLSPPMEYVCKGSQNKSTCPCEEPEWDRSVFSQTTQTKYGIYCEETWLISFSQSMLYVGTVAGSLSFGFLSDRFGRLSMLSLSCLILATFGCLVVMAPSIIVFIIMRCLEGFGLGGCIVTSYVLVVEYCGPKHREVVSSLYHIPINIGHISLAGVSYLLRDCDQYQLAISIPVFLFVFMDWLCLESPKWLLDNNYIDKTVKVMEKIGRFNRSPNDSIRNEIEEYLISKSKVVEKAKFWHIFRDKKLTRNFFCLTVVYFVCGMGYYGVSQYIGKMSGDIHANVAISGAMLLPATITAVFLLKKFGRRTFLLATNLLSGISMIVVVVIPDRLSLLRILFACFCNCFFFMTLIVVFLYGVELFPTTIRNSVIGVLSVLCRLGQTVAPFINSASEFASGLIFGIMALVAGALCYPLPETKGMDLPSSLEDSKRISMEEDRNWKVFMFYYKSH